MSESSATRSQKFDSQVPANDDVAVSDKSQWSQLESKSLRFSFSVQLLPFSRSRYARLPWPHPENQESIRAAERSKPRPGTLRPRPECQQGSRSSWPD